MGSDDGTQLVDVPEPSPVDADAAAHLLFTKDGKTVVVKDEIVVGREQYGDNPTVSARHFKICKDSEAGYTIEDLSSNGTRVNGEKIQRNVPVPLQHGDVVDVSASASSCSFHVRSEEGEMPPRKKRKLVAEPSNSSNVGLAEKLEENLFCSVCQDILYRPVSLLPCLHNFCSHCLGQCLKEKSRAGRIECPMGRCAITGVKRNAMVETMVDTFLEHNPTKRRTDEEMKYFNDNDVLHDANYDISSFQNGGSNDDDLDDDDEDSSTEYLEYCGSCGTGINIVQNQCGKCWVYLCSGACAPVKPADILENATAVNLPLPQIWLKNQVESKILDTILEGQGSDVSAATLSVLSDEEKDLACCRKCTLAKIGEALFTFRKTVPAAQLPEDIRRKRNCWWGKNCRTQLSAPSHAERLNHACEQTRFVGGNAEDVD